MRGSRALAISAALSAFLYLLYHYVAISAAHTVEVFPWRLLGNWSIGSPAGLALYETAIVAALFVLYALASRRVLQGDDLPRERAAVYAGAAASALILILMPYLLSKDVFDYMAHGRILAIHHANPFQIPASAFPSDPFVHAMGWASFTTLYGPGWISACGLLSWAAPDSLAGSLLLYKVFFAAVHVLNGILIGAILRGWGRRSLPGEVLYLWNPLVLSQTLGSAHNDAFLILWVLLGLLFAQRREAAAKFSEDALAAICFAVSVLTKYVTAPILAFFLAARWREEGLRRGWLRAAVLAVAALAVLLLGFLPYGRGIDPLQILRPYQHGFFDGGTLMLLEAVLKKAMPADAQGIHPRLLSDLMTAASQVALGLLAVGGTILLARIRRVEEIPRLGLYVLLAYLLGATAILHMSYGVWLVPLAVLVPRGIARRSVFVFSATLFALEIYYVYAIRVPGGAPSVHLQHAAAVLVAVGVPISYLLAGSIRGWRRGLL